MKCPKHGELNPHRNMATAFHEQIRRGQCPICGHQEGTR